MDFIFIRMVLVIFASSSLGSLAESLCDYSWTCKTSSQIFSPDTCLYYNTTETTFYANPSADSTKMCVWLGAFNGTYININTTERPPPQKALIGEYCATDADCLSPYSVSCKDNLCISAYKAGDQCNSTKWCPAGQYCQSDEEGYDDDSVCVDLIPIGGKCRGGYCVPNSFCGNRSLAYNEYEGYGTCIELFSIKVGESSIFCDSTTEKNFGYNFGCESTVCGIVDGVKKCINAEKSENNLPVKCRNEGEIDTTCTSTMSSDLGKKFKSPCGCGYRKNRSGYCMPFPGDSYYQNYLLLN